MNEQKSLEMTNRYTRDDYIETLNRLERRYLSYIPGSFAHRKYRELYDRVFGEYLTLEDPEFERVETAHLYKGDE